jgi:hypothetical protein
MFNKERDISARTLKKPVLKNRVPQEARPYQGG